MLSNMGSGAGVIVFQVDGIYIYINLRIGVFYTRIYILVKTYIPKHIKNCTRGTEQLHICSFL